jgi:hypothetical protein
MLTQGEEGGTQACRDAFTARPNKPIRPIPLKMAPLTKMFVNPIHPHVALFASSLTGTIPGHG